MRRLLAPLFATAPISRQTSDYEPVQQYYGFNSSLAGSWPSLPSSTPTGSPTETVLNPFAPARVETGASPTPSLTEWFG